MNSIKFLCLSILRIRFDGFLCGESELECLCVPEEEDTNRFCLTQKEKNNDYSLCRLSIELEEPVQKSKFKYWDDIYGNKSKVALPDKLTYFPGFEPSRHSQYRTQGEKVNKCSCCCCCCGARL